AVGSLAKVAIATRRPARSHLYVGSSGYVRSALDTVTSCSTRVDTASCARPTINCACSTDVDALTVRPRPSTTLLVTVSTPCPVASTRNSTMRTDFACGPHTDSSKALESDISSGGDFQVPIRAWE